MLSADYTLWGFATAKNVLVLKYDTKIPEQTEATNYTNQYVLYDTDNGLLADINRKVWSARDNTGWHSHVSVSVVLYNRYGAQTRRINVRDSAAADWVILSRYLWQHRRAAVREIRPDVILDAYRNPGVAAAGRELTRAEEAIVSKIGRQNQK